MSSTIIQVNSAGELEYMLKDNENRLVIIDFFATWCAPCIMMGPTMKEMFEEFKEVVFLKVDVDMCADLTENYEISVMPTFVFIKSGKEIGRIEGASEPKVRELIQANK